MKNQFIRSKFFTRALFVLSITFFCPVLQAKTPSAVKASYYYLELYPKSTLEYQFEWMTCKNGQLNVEKYESLRTYPSVVK